MITIVSLSRHLDRLSTPYDVTYDVKNNNVGMLGFFNHVLRDFLNIKPNTYFEYLQVI